MAYPPGDFARNFLSSNTPYEPWLSDRLIQTIHSGVHFVDIGASIGVYSMLAAAKMAKVTAVEPNPYCNHLLNLSRFENRFEKNISLVPCAASDKRGLVKFVDGRENGNIGDGDILVPSILLDEFFGVEKVDVIKMDVEGHEYHAARGMCDLITIHRPIVFTEFYPRLLKNLGSDPNEYLEFWFERDYSCQVLIRDGSVKSCRNRAEVMSVFKDRADIETGFIAYLDLMFSP